MTLPKDADEYIAIQKAAVGQNPECGNSHYNLAVGYLGQRRLEEAERELHAALECSPGLAEAYVLLGGICLNRGDLEGCLAHNRKAVQVRPGFSEGYGNIGFVELQRGNVDEAIAANHKALKLAPDFAPSHNNLTIAYLEKGEYALAVEHCDKAIALGYDVAPQIRQEIEEHRRNVKK